MEWTKERQKEIYRASYGRCDALVYYQNDWQCSVAVDAVGYDWEIVPTLEEAKAWCEDVVAQLGPAMIKDL